MGIPGYDDLDDEELNTDRSMHQDWSLASQRAAAAARRPSTQSSATEDAQHTQNYAENEVAYGYGSSDERYSAGGGFTESDYYYDDHEVEQFTTSLYDAGTVEPSRDECGECSAEEDFFEEGYAEPPAASSSASAANPFLDSTRSVISFEEYAQKSAQWSAQGSFKPPDDDQYDSNDEAAEEEEYTWYEQQHYEQERQGQYSDEEDQLAQEQQPAEDPPLYGGDEGAAHAEEDDDEYEETATEREERRIYEELMRKEAEEEARMRREEEEEIRMIEELLARQKGGGITGGVTGGITGGPPAQPMQTATPPAAAAPAVSAWKAGAHRPAPPPPMDVSDAKERPAEGGAAEEEHRPETPPELRLGQWPEYDDAEAMANGPMDMCECGVCGRKFAADRLERHQSACQNMKARGSKRKPMDVRLHRWKGAGEAEEYVAKAAKEGKLEKPDGDSQRGEREAKRKKWLSQSAAIRRAARAGKAAPDGGSEDPLPVEEEVDDRVQCPHCLRKFAADPAERHIAKCKDIRAKPKSLKRSSDAERLLGKAKTGTPAANAAAEKAADKAKKDPAAAKAASKSQGDASKENASNGGRLGGRSSSPVPGLDLSGIGGGGPPPKAPAPPSAATTASARSIGAHTSGCGESVDVFGGDAAAEAAVVPSDDAGPPPPSEMEQLHALGDKKFGRGRTAGRRPPQAAAAGEASASAKPAARRQSSGYGTVVKPKTGFGARRTRQSEAQPAQLEEASTEQQQLQQGKAYAASYTAAALPFFKVRGDATDSAEGTQPSSPPGADSAPPPVPPPPPIVLPAEGDAESTAAPPRPQVLSAKTPGGAGFSRTASRVSMLKSPTAKSPGGLKTALSMTVKSPGGYGPGGFDAQGYDAQGYDAGGFDAAAGLAGGFGGGILPAVPNLSKQSSLEDMIKTCPTPTPYSDRPSAWDAITQAAVPAENTTAAARRVAQSPLFERGPTDVRPTRRGSFLGGTPTTSALGRANGLPEYAEVKVERFGWRRGSFISKLNSPLLHAVAGGVSH